ncbi:hypothetical protein AAZX31_07G177700 [Glycine max]
MNNTTLCSIFYRSDNMGLWISGINVCVPMCMQLCNMHDDLRERYLMDEDGFCDTWGGDHTTILRMMRLVLWE